MNKSILKNWKFWLGIGMSALFLYISFRGIHFDKLGKALKQVSPLWLLLGVGAYFVNLGVRAWRWGYIFRHVKKVGFFSMLNATIVGYFANNVLPMRLGEVGRAIYIGEKEHVDKGAALGTIAVERIFDGITAVSILAMAFWMYPFPESMIGEWSGYFKKAGLGLLGVSAFGLFVLIFMAVKRDFTISIINRCIKPFPEKTRHALEKVAHSFIDGLKIVSSPLEVLILMLMSCLVWATNLLPVYCSGRAFNVPGLNFTLEDTMLVLVAGMVAAAVPAGPGFVGTFHYATKRVIGVVLAVKYATGGFHATGIAEANFDDWGLSYAVVVHAMYILTTTLTGAILLSISGMTLAKLKDQGEKSDASAETPKEG